MRKNTQKIELQTEQCRFLSNYHTLGFENESALVSFAIRYLQTQIKKQDSSLEQSFTNLFIEMYQPENVLLN